MPPGPICRTLAYRRPRPKSAVAPPTAPPMAVPASRLAPPTSASTAPPTAAPASVRDGDLLRVRELVEQEVRDLAARIRAAAPALRRQRRDRLVDGGAGLRPELAE